MEETPVIEVEELVKRYGDFTAVAGVSFGVSRGECLGLLGPNGAGKTTTVNVLACSSPPSGGRARVLGRDVALDPRGVKASIGICPQHNNADSDFDVLRNLTVYARYFGIGRREAEARGRELLGWMSLADREKSRVDALSGGMVRRLMLARALVNRPAVLILDEPTTGLDPQARHLIWSLVRQLKERGTSILLTTHYMEEAAHLCDRVLFIDGGKILLAGRPAELVAREVGREVVECWNWAPEVEAWAREQGVRHEVSEGRLFLYPVGSAAAFESRFPHQEHLLRAATLEDVFLKLTGRVLRD